MAHTESVHPHPDDTAVHHETSDADIRRVFGFGAVLLITAVLIHFVVWVIFGYFDSREGQRGPAEYPLAVSQGTQLPPEPRLQAHPREDLRELRSKEDEILNSYGWVDQRAGIVRIPIGEAMKLTVQRGLPARKEKK